MPRTYHIGIKGTFMDTNTHNKYFKDIAVNVDQTFTWSSDAAAAAMAAVRLPAYDVALAAAVRTATPLATVEVSTDAVSVCLFVCVFVPVCVCVCCPLPP